MLDHMYGPLSGREWLDVIVRLYRTTMAGGLLPGEEADDRASETAVLGAG